MLKDHTILEDLVCGMAVDFDEISADYLGNHYVFCSEQCRERFQENPPLYTDPESKSPLPEKSDFYRHTILKLPEALPVVVADKLTAYVRTMMGIQYIEAYDDEIELSYDPKQATESQIEAAITRFGETMGEEWAAILGRAVLYTSWPGEPGISHLSD